MSNGVLIAIFVVGSFLVLMLLKSKKKK